MKGLTGDEMRIAPKIVSRALRSVGVKDNSIEALMHGVPISKLRSASITNSILNGISKSLDTYRDGGSLVQVSNIGRGELRMRDEKGRVEVAVNIGAIKKYLPKGCSNEEAIKALEKIKSENGGADFL